jgi:hypothetical protein
VKIPLISVNRGLQMGGYGSTRWGSHRRKDTVEECIKLDAARVLPPSATLSSRTPAGNLITWSTNGRVWGAISAFVDYDPLPCLRLGYGIATRERVVERVALVETYPFNQVARWWFQCPTCQRRCRCLYKPPASRRFACRKCHDLSYNAQQEASPMRAAERIVPGLARWLRVQKLEARIERCIYRSKRYRRLVARCEGLSEGRL